MEALAIHWASILTLARALLVTLGKIVKMVSDVDKNISH